MNAGFFAKMKGQGRSPLKVDAHSMIVGGIGGFITISLLTLLSNWSSALWLMAPFGASCVLAFGLWESPLSQPRNIIGGHFLSALTGLVMFHLFGTHFWSMALATSLAIILMMLTRTTHPPAGANPVLVMLAGSGWSFLLTPVLSGSLILVAAALVINNLDKRRKYPSFWL
ncbi:HPP family protein [Saccharibacillus kuerlensis]|nr:HPP family protein [Saccharibacillus kuerlensis]